MMPTGELSTSRAAATSERDLIKAVIATLSDGREVTPSQLLESVHERGCHDVAMGGLYRCIESLIAAGRIKSREGLYARAGEVRIQRLLWLSGVPFVSQADLQARVRLDSLDAEAKAEMLYQDRDEDRLRRTQMRVVPKAPRKASMPRLVKWGIPFVAAGVLLGVWAAWPEAHPAILFLSATTLLIACCSSLVAGPKPPEPKI